MKTTTEATSAMGRTLHELKASRVALREHAQIRPMLHLLENDRLIAALHARDRALGVSELESHRYSTESGMPNELPCVVPEPPARPARKKTLVVG